METLTLRGHHLLCSRLFSGHGYDEKFAERMGEVVSRTGLENYKPSEAYETVKSIKVICGDDYVCEKCPNLAREQAAKYCRQGDADVKNKDKKTLEYAKLKENGVYSLEEIQKHVNLITETQYNEICQTCRWFKAGYCRYSELVKGNADKNLWF